MPPGDASVVAQLLGSGMNRLVDHEFPPSDEKLFLVVCVFLCRSPCDFWNLLLEILCNDKMLSIE